MPETASESKANILIVDDEVLIAADLKSRLMGMGYTVCGEAISGEQALDLARQYQPDLVFMDIVLRGRMDGIDAAEIIRDRWSIPVVFLTAYADEDRLKRARLVYPFGYLMKPVKDYDLRITAEMALYVGKVDAERRKAEKELRQSEDRLHIALNAANSGTWEWDLATGENFWSDELWDLYCLEPHACKPSYESWRNSIHPDDRQRAEDAVSKAASEGSVLKTEWRVNTPDGSERWLMSRGSPLMDENGQSQKYFGVVIDITDRKRAEKRLSFQLYLLSNVTDSVLSTDENFMIRSWNDMAESMYGWKADEVIGRNVVDVLNPEYLNITRAEVIRIVRETGKVRWEGVHSRKDGKRIFVEGKTAAMRDASGNVIGFATANRDITDRKRLEAERQKFMMLADSSSEFIGMCDLDMKPLYVNPAGMRMVGLPDMAAACRVKVEDYFFSEDRAFITEEFFPRVLREGHGDVEIRLRHFQTGEPIWMFYYLFCVLDACGKAVGWATVSRDITERKEAEKDLIESERRYRSLFENMNAGFVLFEVVQDEKGDVVDLVIIAANQGFEATTGLKMPEVAGQRLTRVLPGIENDAADWIGTYGRVALTGEPLQLEQGSNLLGYHYSINAYKSGPKQCAVTFLDITERKQSEEKTRRQQYYLEKSQELGRIGTWELDLVHNKLYWTDENCRLFGEPAGSVVDYELFLDKVHPDDRNYVNRKWKAALERKPYDIEHRIVVDNKISWVREKAEVEFNDEGMPVRAIGFTQDVTYRKKAEKALMESEKKYRSLLDSLQEGIWVIDAGAYTTFVNPSMAKMLGYTQEEMEGKHLFEFMDEQGVIFAKRNLERRLKGVHEQHDFEFVGKYGNRVYTSVETSPLVDERGKYIGAIAGVQNITERKHAEDRILHLNRVLLAIRGVNQLIVRERDEATLIREGCRVLVQNRGYATALIVLLDESGVIGQWAKAGMGEAFDSVRELLDNGALPPCFSHVQKTGEALTVDDRKSICGDCPITRQCADSQSMCVALVQGDDLYGYLTVSAEPQLLVDDEERSLFSEMAYDLAYALHGLKISKIRKETEKERDALEGQLLQAQKMESVGRLAGGVAHDFNNMLTIILGNAEMAAAELSKDDPLFDSLNEIINAGKRAADLTRQLLAFARKQVIKPVVLDLNETVEGMLKMLRRLLGEDIEILWRPSPAIWPVNVDPAQIDQIMANLCVNARDAILGPGKVTVETQQVVFDAEYCENHNGFSIGEFVMLAVSDNGDGIDRENVENIFEPFFTTKKEGQGTGLGLSMVYGIVKQNNGFINVYSEPGRGTTFKVYLPRHEGEATITEDRKVTKAMKGRGETILLVEDDPNILRIGKTVLERLGYIVLTSHSPEEALRLAQEFDGEIDLLLTDVIMPEMNGRELADLIDEIRPGMKCLFMSGYTANVIAHHGVIDKGVHFVQKPLTMLSLAEKVREALDY